MNLQVVLRSGIGEPRNSEAVDDIEQRDRERGNLYSKWFITDLRAESRRTGELGFFFSLWLS